MSQKKVPTNDLKAAQSVNMHIRLAQQFYITINAHALNYDWSPMSFTLKTLERKVRNS